MIHCGMGHKRAWAKFFERPRRELNSTWKTETMDEIDVSFLESEKVNN